MDYKTLGSILKEARINSKLKQSEVAEILNVTFQNISSWELGKSKIDIETLIKLCNMYKIDFSSVIKQSNLESKKAPSTEAPEASQEILSQKKKDLLARLANLPDDVLMDLLEYAEFRISKRNQ